MTQDIRELLFQPIMTKRFSAQVTAEREGVIAGNASAARKFSEIGIVPDFLVQDGEPVRSGDPIARFQGNPLQISLAEEQVIGQMAKFSGIATAARRAVQLSRGQCRIATGGLKKVPSEIRQEVRNAVVAGGASPRILDVPFLYLDKNYVRIFGGIGRALQAASLFADRVPVVQLKGETAGIREETLEAVRGGAGVIMVDTGEFADVETAIRTLDELGVRAEKKVAFAEDLRMEDIPRCLSLGIDLLCIGKEIIDAPLLDMKLDVIAGC
jgi:nicotinate-nucleotide pyrophosphorylase (carboxylating)